MHAYCATNIGEARASLKPLYNLAPHKNRLGRKKPKELELDPKVGCGDGEEGAGKSEGSRLYALETNKRGISAQITTC